MVWNPNSSNSVEIVCVDVDLLVSPLCRALLLRRNVDRIDGATYGGQLGVSQKHHSLFHNGYCDHPRTAICWEVFRNRIFYRRTKQVQ